MKKTNRNRVIVLAAAAASLSLSSGAFAQMSITTPTFTYAENFNSLPTTTQAAGIASGGIIASLPTGWVMGTAGNSTTTSQPEASLLTTTGATASGALNAGSETVNSGAGGFYSFATSTNTSERSLGTLGSGGNARIIGLVLKNDTTATLNSFSLSYTGEQWRQGTSGTIGVTPNFINFDYRIDTSTPVVSNAAVGSTSTGATAVNALRFQGPKPTLASGTANIDGNLAANQQTGISASITGLTWAPGQSIILRWIDMDSPGTDSAFAIDDVAFAITSFTPGVQASGQSLKWKGTPSGTWSTTNTDTAWVTNGGSGSTPLYFSDTDNVLFDSSTATTSAIVSGTVAPASVTLSNGATPFTFTGTGAVNLGPTGALSFTGSNIVFGGPSLTNAGSLTVSGNNTIAVTAGTIALGSGVLALPASSSLAVSGTGSVTASGVTVSGGGLSVASGSFLNAGALAVSTGSTVSIGGSVAASGVTVSAATLTFATGSQLTATGPVVVSGGATLSLGGAANASTGFTSTGTGSTLQVTSTGTVVSNGQLTGTGAADVQGSLTVFGVSMAATGSLTVSGKLKITGGGAYNLSAPTGVNALTGIIDASTAPRLNFNVGDFLGHGTILLSATGSVGSSLTIANAGTINASQANLDANIVLNSSGVLSQADFTLNLGSSQAAGTSGRNTLNYTGSISGVGNVNFAVGSTGGAGTTILGNTSTYTGDTYVNSSSSGIHQWGINDAIPTTTSLIFNTNANTTSGPGLVDLHGYNQTVAALKTGGGNLANSAGVTAWNGGRVVNTTGTMSTLTVNITAGATATFSGALGGALSIVKAGPGQQSLIGSIAMTGTVKATGGSLVVKPNFGTAGTTLPAFAASSGGVVVGVLPAASLASTFDVFNNDLVLTGTSESSIRALVASNALFSSLSGATTADPRDTYAGLAVITNDNLLGAPITASLYGAPTTLGDVLVKYTYKGDANLDGKVDVDDLQAWQLGFATQTAADGTSPLTGWANGDFDYNGTIDLTDLALLTASLGNQGAAFGGSIIDSGSTAAVPEPSALALLLPALPLLTRRRRRR